MVPRAESVDATADDEDASPPVAAHETVPGRFVFTESGNTDGWIATDLAVDVADLA